MGIGRFVEYKETRPLSFSREVRVKTPDAYECQDKGIDEHEYKTCKLK